ncbi:sulfurtransferase TusA family protein [Ferrovum myxofaciens]|jgi:tRNA 2-thiouridine synthesizing protein A|uniref:Sulfurtransferase TusA n=2 Tax=root TaxID=1 RepID=A0A8F3DZU0_9PROT|nr:sulfurtransferase TusA family protein [Ferrovum myxofaciens]MBW8028292.1 preprotein translocase subunit TatC [Ferrovum sp.]KXW58998.1 sulfurtransferase TusA [Ferrovum myxofaciens]MBU6993834.1 sulfurtransferase TusA family protein [Ferrovum myxofaciens]NDU89765.1 sulfurtransferase TusA family protein [Ferrovum sp.]QKE37779.1 MAG: sulfurtransferase TusA family protein [Ferrovum myxofaciens]
MQADKELDVRGMSCPLPILKTKKSLADMVSGQVLRIISTDVGSMGDIQAFSKQTGHELISAAQEGSEYTFFLRKK